MTRAAPRAIVVASLLVGSVALAAPPRARWRPPVRRGYADAVKRWHAAPPDAKPTLDASGRPMLVLFALNTGERLAIPAARDDGGFDAASLDRAARLLRDPRGGLAHPVEPALLDLVYRAERRFSAPEIRVVSGYRAPKHGSASNHGRGRAMDLVVPGAKDDDVATWARSLGFTGVGLYPTSGFCHLDVRPRSHFWIDASGPGQRNRERAVFGSVAARSDDEARRRDERPIGPFVLPRASIDAAWGEPPAATEQRCVGCPSGDDEAEDDARTDG